MFTEMQKQIIDGSLLGDASIWTNFKNPNKKFTKAQSKLDNIGCDKCSYMDWHMKEFKEFSSSVKPNSFKGINNKIYNKYTFTTHMDKLWNDVEKRWYIVNLDNNNNNIKRIKIVPKDLVLTPLTLCIWHMDDGCNNPKDANIELNTQGFSVEDIDFLIDRLDKDLNIKSHKKKDRNNQFKIYVGRESYFDFIEMIKPHVEWDCFQYKIDTSAYNKKPHKGEDHSLSILTESKVKEIFKLSDSGLPQKDIAKKIGVSKANISLILSGERWSHLGMKRKVTRKPRITKEQKAIVLELNEQGLFQKEIAATLNIHQGTVSRILRGNNAKNRTNP